MGGVSVDASDFLNKTKQLMNKVERTKMRALSDAADELLRLSQFEVPLDKSRLMNSGTTEPEDDYYLVGYNTPYAARLHEHPEYKFQNGRKGKYLEGPLKRNTALFRNTIKEKMGEAFN